MDCPSRWKHLASPSARQEDIKVKRNIESARAIAAGEPLQSGILAAFPSVQFAVPAREQPIEQLSRARGRASKLQVHGKRNKQRGARIPRKTKQSAGATKLAIRRGGRAAKMARQSSSGERHLGRGAMREERPAARHQGAGARSGKIDRSDGLRRICFVDALMRERGTSGFARAFFFAPTIGDSNA